MHHAFVDAFYTKLEAFAKAHELARDQQQQREGEIEFGTTAHDLPPSRGVTECEFVGVVDDARWVVFQS
ncbi:hypothetical protein B4589_009735 [Halolamina sp. CBA1230]|uniref:hypothetical protein n=1 Tax=Halolamina sp. CBA1230 TaxID=1853690 RepID=UPI0009A1BF86|nr:hypothetical protein [Halolamina sp. CBA1230]QKY20645.1 hypothetical protein B4589_009735 [Halolamina sp. CBA1230]